MANPCWTNEERNHHNVYSRNSTIESFFMRHNAGIAISWDTQEQATLVDGLARYSLEPNFRRYVLIASELKDKTVRDVAARCKWLYNKENSKRRKEDHNGLVRARVDNKEVNSTPASDLFGTSPLIGEEEDGIAYVLLNKNKQLFNQISANFTSPLELRDNLNLFTESLANFRILLTNLNENMCEPMKCMPPLPVKLNEELFDAVMNPPSNLPNLQNDSSLFFSSC